MMVLQTMAGQPSLPAAMKKNTTEIRPEADRIACSMSSPMAGVGKCKRFAHCSYSIRNMNKKINQNDPVCYQRLNSKSLISQGIFPGPPPLVKHNI